MKVQYTRNRHQKYYLRSFAIFITTQISFEINTGKDSSINLDELCSDDECEDRQKPLPLPECFGQGEFSVTDSTASERKRRKDKSSRTSYFGTKQLKLYNMELDPFEINDVSDSNIEIVNFLLVKMANYYVSRLN